MGTQWQEDNRKGREMEKKVKEREKQTFLLFLHFYPKATSDAPTPHGPRVSSLGLPSQSTTDRMPQSSWLKQQKLGCS